MIATLDPLSYGVDGMRAALTGVGHFGMGMDIAVLLILCAVLLGVGGWLFSRIQL